MLTLAPHLPTQDMRETQGLQSHLENVRNTTPRNLSFFGQYRVSVIYEFLLLSCAFEDFQILEPVSFGEGLTVSQGTIWGKRPQGIITI